MKYVIQRQLREQGKEGEKYDAWIDIATVEVEPRITRRTALKMALAEAGIVPGTEEMKVRVLDEESASVRPVRPFRPPLEWSL